eukprot:6277854-Prymnesium_polylepis.1
MEAAQRLEPGRGRRRAGMDQPQGAAGAVPRSSAVPQEAPTGRPHKRGVPLQGEGAAERRATCGARLRFRAYRVLPACPPEACEPEGLLKAFA